jgi:hypothetical protein
VESRLALTLNGQSVQVDDINLIATEAALADDRLLWELIRLQKQSVSPQKAILTYGKSGWAKESGLSSTALIQGNASDGSIRVMPFKALIASTDSSSQQEMLRGMRSGYLVGSSTQYEKIVLSANASGSPRWTAVYAAVTPATNSASVVRYVKDPVSKTVTGTNVVLTTTCAVTIGTVDGTPAGTPTRPSVPADSGGTFYILLAHIWIPNGFGASSVVLRNYIHECAPVITLHSTMGVTALQPANQCFTIGGTVDTNQLDATQQYRPGCYLPSTLVGGEARLIPVQLSLSPASHTHGAVVDNSVDWRFRVFKWQVLVVSGSAQANGFVWDRLSGGGQQNPRADISYPYDTFAQGMGQSFYATAPTVTGYTMPAITNFGGYAAWLDDGLATSLGAFGSAVGLYVNSSDGSLRFAKSSSGGAGGQIFFWLEASAPLSNFGTV